MPQPAEMATALVVAAQKEDGSETVLGRLDAGDPDIALVDALMRLQLAARRQGWRVRVRGAPADLCGLLELVGLARVVGVEAPRQPELREQLGVQEVVQPGDPPV